MSYTTHKQPHKPEKKHILQNNLCVSTYKTSFHIKLNRKKHQRKTSHSQNATSYPLKCNDKTST